MQDFGFIIIRHVNNARTNNYWIENVTCLRRHYPQKKIVIIDDNSNYQFIHSNIDFHKENITLIQSEFHGRGELLPYYYFLKHHFFDHAIIIHDSVFFHRRIPFERFVNANLPVLPLWHFDADKENYTNTLRIASALSNANSIRSKIVMNGMGSKALVLKPLYNDPSNWYGCFGVQCFIQRAFLLSLEHKYNISRMIQQVTCRADRCCIERVFGILFFTECQKINSVKSVFGRIHSYLKWGYTFEEYRNDLQQGRVPKPVIKVWTGR